MIEIQTFKLVCTCLSTRHMCTEIGASFSHEVSKFKGPLSSLNQFMVNESPSKMKKNARYFAPKALFVLKIFNKIFNFLPWLFCSCRKTT